MISIQNSSEIVCFSVLFSSCFFSVWMGEVNFYWFQILKPKTNLFTSVYYLLVTIFQTCLDRCIWWHILEWQYSSGSVFKTFPVLLITFAFDVFLCILNTFKTNFLLIWKRSFPHMNSTVLNPFYTTDLFWYQLKRSENLWFSGVFWGYQKRSMAWNGLNVLNLLDQPQPYQKSSDINF